MKSKEFNHKYQDELTKVINELTGTLDKEVKDLKYYTVNIMNSMYLYEMRAEIKLSTNLTCKYFNNKRNDLPKIDSFELGYVRKQEGTVVKLSAYDDYGMLLRTTEACIKFE